VSLPERLEEIDRSVRVPTFEGALRRTDLGEKRVRLTPVDGEIPNLLIERSELRKTQALPAPPG
jgi:hypothetical protein